MCNGTRLAAHSRATLPVFGGISGSTRAILIIRSETRNKRNDEFRLKYSSFLLKGLAGLRKCLCASGRLLLYPAGSNYLFLAAFLAPPFLAAFLAPPFFAADFFPPFLVAIAYVLLFCFWFFRRLTTRYCAYLFLVG